jgi:hypothetical protein
MKVQKGVEIKLYSFCNLGARWRWLTNATPRPIYTGKGNRYQFYCNLAGPQSMLTGYNTLRRHSHIMGLCNDPICRKCGTEEETSVHILCECDALASLTHAYLGFFFLDTEDIGN